MERASLKSEAFISEVPLRLKFFGVDLPGNLCGWRSEGRRIAPSESWNRLMTSGY